MGELRGCLVKALTEKQREALKIIAEGPRSSWEFASTTVSRLRRDGFVRNEQTKVGRQLAITDAGRKALGGA